MIPNVLTVGTTFKEVEDYLNKSVTLNFVITQSTYNKYADHSLTDPIIEQRYYTVSTDDAMKLNPLNCDCSKIPVSLVKTNRPFMIHDAVLKC